MKQNWTYKKLDDCCVIEYGTRVVQKKDGGTIYPVYGGGGETFRMDRYNREDCLVVARFAMSKTCVRYVAGKFFLNDSGLSVNAGEELLQSYLNHHIMYLNDDIYNLGKGAAQRNLDVNAFRKLIIAFPPLSTQQSIVAELDEINNLLSLKRKELDAYDQLAQSLFYEMFGDPVDNEKGWEVNSMPNVCSIIDGDRGTNYPKQDEFHENGYCLFLNAKNVTSTGFNFESCSFITKEKDEILRKGKLNRGDVVLTTRGTIGNLAYYDNSIPYDNVRINSGMVILRMDKTVIHEVFYIKQFSLHLNNIKRRIASGSAQPQLPISTMNKIKLIIPPLSLQQTFATRIEAIEEQKANVKAAIEKLETLLAARMQYWFE